jgi:hypothetical protein
MMPFHKKKLSHGGHALRVITDARVKPAHDRGPNCTQKLFCA